MAEATVVTTRVCWGMIRGGAGEATRRRGSEGRGRRAFIDLKTNLYVSLKSSKRVMICCQNTFESLKRLLHRAFLPLKWVQVGGFHVFFFVSQS